MKKPVILLSVLIFSMALVIASLTWADKQEGSGTKESGSSSTSHSDEYKDKKHSKEYSSDKAGYMEEGSGAKQPQDKSSDHKKMEEGGSAVKPMKTTAPKREGS